ncbi:unnamed protein product [Pleuronectes platessa]|uniref:Uncharacterized protein n=1 Tax=Pleuronectes platessa TaxID=8262 RepID=A0A9N7TS06_PLEPL|nr:unnamed protein product [Pleuronectes platessa]
MWKRVSEVRAAGSRGLARPPVNPVRKALSWDNAAGWPASLAGSMKALQSVTLLISQSATEAGGQSVPPTTTHRARKSFKLHNESFSRSNKKQRYSTSVTAGHTIAPTVLERERNMEGKKLNKAMKKKSNRQTTGVHMHNGATGEEVRRREEEKKRSGEEQRGGQNLASPSRHLF